MKAMTIKPIKLALGALALTFGLHASAFAQAVEKPDLVFGVGGKSLLTMTRDRGCPADPWLYGVPWKPDGWVEPDRDKNIRTIKSEETT